MLPALTMIISAYCVSRLIQIWLEMNTAKNPNFRAIANAIVLGVNLLAIAIILLNVFDVVPAGNRTSDIPGLMR
jgi:hypothetical protein